MTEIMQQLIDMLKDASPAIWQVLMRQVYADAYMTIGFGVVLLLIASVFAHRDEFYDDTFYILLVIGGSFTLFALPALATGIMMLLNPEFYAIKYILKSLGGG